MLGLLFSIPCVLGAPGLGLRLVPYGVVVLTAGAAAGILIAAIADAFFPSRPTSRDEDASAPGGPQETGNASTIRQRLAEERGYLEHLDAQREYLGDPRFEKATEDRIVWRELLDLELQDIDERVRRISQTAGDEIGGRPRISSDSPKSFF